MAGVMIWVSQEFQDTTTATINIWHPHEDNTSVRKTLPQADILTCHIKPNKKHMKAMTLIKDLLHL